MLPSLYKGDLLPKTKNSIFSKHLKTLFWANNYAHILQNLTFSKGIYIEHGVCVSLPETFFGVMGLDDLIHP